MKKTIFTLFGVLLALGAWAAHPSLLLTAEGVAEMREARGKVPAFDAAMSRTLAGADAALAASIFHRCIPIKLFPSSGMLLVIMMVLIWSPQKLRLIRSWFSASVTLNGSSGILLISSSLILLPFVSRFSSRPG